MFIYNALNSATYICPSYACWSGSWINSTHFITLRSIHLSWLLWFLHYSKSKSCRCLKSQLAALRWIPHHGASCSSGNPQRECICSHIQPTWYFSSTSRGHFVIYFSWMCIKSILKAKQLWGICLSEQHSLSASISFCCLFFLIAFQETIGNKMAWKKWVISEMTEICWSL